MGLGLEIYTYIKQVRFRTRTYKFRFKYDDDDVPLFVLGDINNRQIQLPVGEIMPDSKVNGVKTKMLIVRSKMKKDGDKYNDYLARNVKHTKLRKRKGETTRLESEEQEIEIEYNDPESLGEALAGYTNDETNELEEKQKNDVIRQMLAGDSMRYHFHWMREENKLNVVEPKINFLPTYKRETGDANKGAYKNNDVAIPAYCDRVVGILPTDSPWAFEEGSYQSLPEFTI